MKCTWLYVLTSTVTWTGSVGPIMLPICCTCRVATGTSTNETSCGDCPAVGECHAVISPVVAGRWTLAERPAQHFEERNPFELVLHLTVRGYGGIDTIAARHELEFVHLTHEFSPVATVRSIILAPETGIEEGNGIPKRIMDSEDAGRTR